MFLKIKAIRVVLKGEGPTVSETREEGEAGVGSQGEAEVYQKWDYGCRASRKRQPGGTWVDLSGSEAGVGGPSRACLVMN